MIIRGKRCGSDAVKRLPRWVGRYGRDVASVGVGLYLKDLVRFALVARFSLSACQSALDLGARQEPSIGAAHHEHPPHSPTVASPRDAR